MSSAFFKTVKQVFPTSHASKSSQEIANLISKFLVNSASKTLPIPPSLLSNLNSHTTHLVLSDPQVPAKSCLHFFKFLQNKPSLTSNEPNLQAHVTLVWRLLKARNFIEAKNVLNNVALDDDLRRPVSEIASLLAQDCQAPKIVSKLFDMLFRVYADNQRFKEGLEVFEYMKNHGFELDERSCMVYLVALKRHNQVEPLLDFFRRMLESGVIITVYSMAIVVDCLSKVGRVEKARKLVKEMVGQGIKPNAYTYNTLLAAYMGSLDFGKVKEVLNEMEKEGVAYNAITYTILIHGWSGSGKMEEAEKLFNEMLERGIEPDVHVYTTLISWHSKAGNMKRAFLLFDELTERGLIPNVHTYGALINGLCKAGQMEAVGVLLQEMQRKGIDVNQVIFNTLMDGYCRTGMIDQAFKLQVLMEKKGLKADVVTYNIIASELCNLSRHEEAKMLLCTMVDKGVAPNTMSFTTLIDIYCKEGNFVEAKRLLREMKNKGAEPNIVTYNALIDGYSKKGKMKEAHKLRDEMEEKGFKPDIYTYTSLVHGECIYGKVDEAFKIFNEMPAKGLSPNVVAYTAMISGLSCGLLAGDVILAVDGFQLPETTGPGAVSEVVDVIKKNPKRNVLIKIARGQEDFEIGVTPDENSDGTGRIGVQLSPNIKISKVRPKSLTEALNYSGREFWGLTSNVLDSLKQTFLNFSQSASKVSGPVAIIAVGAEVAKSNIDGLYQFAAVLNLNLAVINILPLPALDGGSLALILIEAARGGRKLPLELEQQIMSSGIMFVIILGVFLIIRDTLNLDFIKDML